MMDYQTELNISEIFRSELLPNEKIEWTGQPDPSKHFTKQDIFLVPFSLLWGGFAFCWEAGVLGPILKSGSHKDPMDIIFPLFGLPFIIVGIYFIFGRFIYKAWRKRHTFYAITNLRIIIVTSTRSKEVSAIYLRDIPIINKMIGSDGVGSIIFGNIMVKSIGSYGNTDLEWFGSRSGPLPPAFYDIHDADSVYELVNRLRNQSNESGF